MKVLKACQNIQNIRETDGPLLAKSFNTSRFCLSRVFLIKTEKDYRIISANLLDRIVAFCRSLFGRTYESSFAQKLHVKSVKILDRKACDLKCQKVKEQIVVPEVPRVHSEAIRREARRDHFRSVLRHDQDLEKLFTDEQRACANSAVEAITQTGECNQAVALEINLPAEARAELMDYLVRKDIIAAWASGGGNTTMVKYRSGDAVQARDLQLTWRNKQTLETERRFQQKNRIGFFHQEQYETLIQSQLSREDILLLIKIIHQLNKRGGYGPQSLQGSSSDVERCLQYLKNQQMIHTFRRDQGKWVVFVSSMDDLQNQQHPKAPPSFLPKQKNAIDLVLGALARNKMQNYPRVFNVDFRNLTPEMTQQVMNYLLLQGQVVGWNFMNGFVDATECSDDLDRLPPPNGHWRKRDEAQRDQEASETGLIPIYSKHLDALERSALSQDEIIALMQVVNNLNQGKIKENVCFSNDYYFVSQTGQETAGLNFLRNVGLILDFTEQRRPLQQGVETLYHMTIRRNAIT